MRFLLPADYDQIVQSISVAIVTFNEAHNLARTLESVSWVNEIVVVDSGSTDGTIELATNAGAFVFHEPWRGYGAQVNSALDHCSGDWILNVDADEVVSPFLALEIQNVLTAGSKHIGYTIPRKNNIFGRWMKHGGLYPDRKLRLFRRGMARLAEDTEPHATPKAVGNIGRLNGEIFHYQYPTLSSYIEHMNRYSTASVPLLVRRGKTSQAVFGFEWNAILNPITTFMYNYVFRLGFLDGREGLLFHLNHSLYVNWKYVKAWKREKSNISEKTPGPSDPFFD